MSMRQQMNSVSLQACIPTRICKLECKPPKLNIAGIRNLSATTTEPPVVQSIACYGLCRPYLSAAQLPFPSLLESALPLAVRCPCVSNRPPK